MYWLCAPYLRLWALFCWEHSEFKRPTIATCRLQTVTTPERETSPVFVFDQAAAVLGTALRGL
jgi:hypothetical protein